MVYNWTKFVRYWLARSCLLCGDACAADAEHALCAGCHRSLPFNHTHCRRCALPLAPNSPEICGRCQRDPPPFARIVAPLRYEYPVAELIIQLKHRHRLAAGRTLGRLLAAAAATAGQKRPDVLIAVPLHAVRLRERGFNQAMELAQTVGRELGIPILHGALTRVSPTTPQASLKRAQRLRNLRQAFSTTGKSLPRHVALIDDVVTTGATVEAIARKLNRAGAETIEVWSVARTPSTHR